MKTATDQLGAAALEVGDWLLGLAPNAVLRRHVEALEKTTAERFTAALARGKACSMAKGVLSPPFCARASGRAAKRSAPSDCEHNSSSEGNRSSASLNIASARSESASLLRADSHYACPEV
jgi:hypothetical protein